MTWRIGQALLKIEEEFKGGFKALHEEACPVESDAHENYCSDDMPVKLESNLAAIPLWHHISGSSRCTTVQTNVGEPQWPVAWEVTLRHEPAQMLVLSLALLWYVDIILTCKNM